MIDTDEVFLLGTVEGEDIQEVLQEVEFRQERHSKEVI